jgi:hypothetical protein
MVRRVALLLFPFFVIAWASATYATLSIARADLIAFGASQNAILVRTFANTVWPDIRDAVRQNASQLRGNIRTGELFDRIDGQIRRFAEGTGVLKVKIYSPAGRTIYSSENRQIGEDKSDNEGVIRALKGETPSELAFRDTFSTFDRELSRLNLFSTYVPVRDGAGAVEAVIEIYVTADTLAEKLNRAQALKAAWLGAAFLALYAVALALIARFGEPEGDAS